jgi:hypothetical protein
MPNDDRPHRTPASLGRVVWRYLFTLVVLTPLISASQATAPPARPAVSVTQGADGRLVCTTDGLGNRIIDFSHAGYAGGGIPLPDVPARIRVAPDGTHDRERIQAALDLVAAMPLDSHGFRGAVLLEPGRFVIDGALRLAGSGVVLRGSGDSEDGTVLVAAGQSRRSFVVIAGTGTRLDEPESRTPIADAYVPAGARSFNVEHGAAFRVGQLVVIHRPSTPGWIAALGMNTFAGWRPENRLHWQPGSRDVEWDRVVTAVDGNRVTVDAPITTALDKDYGGGWIALYEFPGRIARVGVEDLRLVSAHDTTRPHDEDHAWDAIVIDKAENVWVRRVAVRHFAGHAVQVASEAKWVTVELVDAGAPVSELGGYRRRVFHTEGQLTLFTHCRSEQGLHDFVVGFAAAGPNVFLQCSAHDARGFSGPLESWASGVLYDSVTIRGNALRFTNQMTADQGQGWAAANSVMWNCDATDIEVMSPPGAVNQAYGCKGMVTGDGVVWDQRTMPYRDFYRGMPVEPTSLYLAQLAERLGASAASAIEPAMPPTTPADVRLLAEQDVAAFIARERDRNAGSRSSPLRAQNGVFIIDGLPAWTARTSYSWFQAQMPRTLAPSFGPAITRFAPGKTGTGWTDDLEAVADAMAPRSAFYQHYGLWYDRRRVDHNYYGSPEQRTSDVWAPFMELPWARSGTGKAWDGLSLFDLTRFNPWFFDRMKAFADLADRKGLILYHNFYFQHWLLESRSHYVDFPWRPVNTIQPTGLPDEVPAANVFYDVTDPMRRDLHRRYIRHALDTFGGNTNVVHGIDREYTGPIEFVRFWLDTIREWQAERRKQVFIALEIPKDQMDAILEDPVRGPMISAVDVLGWVYRADGTLFAARGAINRAPREQRPDIATPQELAVLKQKLGISALDQKDFLNSPEFQKLFDTLWAGSKPMKYRAWREYRDRYPHIVTLWKGDEYPVLTAAVERRIPAAIRVATRPADVVRSSRDTAWAMARAGMTILVYVTAGQPIEVDLASEARPFAVVWVADAGTAPAAAVAVQGGRAVTLTPPSALAGRPAVAWLTRK